MTTASSLLSRLIVEEEAASASEYAVLTAFVAVAVAAAVKLFDLGSVFTSLGTKVSATVGSAK